MLTTVLKQFFITNNLRTTFNETFSVFEDDSVEITSRLAGQQHNFGSVY
jgi:hypothetical protein